MADSKDHKEPTKSTKTAPAVEDIKIQIGGLERRVLELEVDITREQELRDACPADADAEILYALDKISEENFVTRTKLFCDHMRLWAVVGISEFKELKTEMTDVLKKLNVLCVNHKKMRAKHASQ